jgi:7-keto-8-aminopelargonate synthetase-like enzyme
MMIYAVAAMAVVLLFESWCLWRVLDRLGAIDRFEDRLANLSHTLMLLTDTTETCFQVVANQLEKEQPARPAAASRAGRQRRIVTAAKRGKALAEIAAEEEVAESEARLRVQLSPQGDRQERVSRGSMLA